MRLKGKVALVTGAGRGIGRAIAERYAREGAAVLVADVDAAAAAEAVAGIVAAGGQAEACALDVRNKAEVERAIDVVEARFGPLDILVANAGICELTPFLEIEEEAWDRHLDINLKGVFLCGQAAARRMAAGGRGGRIINMSSVNGLAGEADQAHYNASKGGVTLLTMSMALDLAAYGINVNAIAPGFIATRLTRATVESPTAGPAYARKIPLGRLGQPQDLTGAAVFLASDDAAYVTGHVLVVDGGQIVQL
ncbi:MAG TPA: glucose 1-dehydrogenase [Limnochordia bacterium]|nr:glucose 1-dehydrogenase [Limnochordia bacterium]